MHLGSVPFHTPSGWQVLTLSPSSAYPLLHEYLALDPGVNVSAYPPPFSIDDTGGQNTEESAVSVQVKLSLERKSDYYHWELLEATSGGPFPLHLFIRKFRTTRRKSIQAYLYSKHLHLENGHSCSLPTHCEGTPQFPPHYQCIERLPATRDQFLGHM